MNLFIYVLLLFIWTTSCLNTTRSNGSSTTGFERLQSMLTKIENVQRYLLILGTVATIIRFIFTSVLFFFHNCPSDETVVIRNESIPAKSPRSSKISFRKSTTASSHDLEEQCMLLGTDTLSGPSRIRSSSTPSSTENLFTPQSPKISSIRSSIEKLIRPSSKPSSPKIVCSSSNRKESRRSCSLDNLHELADSDKRLSQGSLSYPNVAVRSPCPANLQYSVRSTKPTCPPCTQNQTGSSRYSNVKKSVGKGTANMVSRPHLIKPRQCYQEKFLVSITASETLANDISEPMKTNPQKIPFPCQVLPVSKYFHEVDSKDDALYGNVNDSNKKTKYSEDGSDEEVTIICNVTLSGLLPKHDPKSALNKNKKHT